MWGEQQWKGGEQERGGLSPGRRCWITAQPFLSFLHWLPAPGAPRTLRVHPEGVQEAAQRGRPQLLSPRACRPSCGCRVLHRLIATGLIPIPSRVWLLATYTQFKCHQYLSTLNGSYLGCICMPTWHTLLSHGLSTLTKQVHNCPCAFHCPVQKPKIWCFSLSVRVTSSTVQNCASQSKHQKQHHL